MTQAGSSIIQRFLLVSRYILGYKKLSFILLSFDQYNNQESSDAAAD